jgi:hypothetical protein
MWVEAVAAAFVGLSLLWLVLEPVFTTAGGRSSEVLDMDAFQDLEDTPRGVALAALKEIEFDRETGKLSDRDYEFLKQKYTVEALDALRAEDGPDPAELEAQVAARVSQMQGDARGGSFCATCGNALSTDSRFCGACGGPVVP